MKFVMKVVRDSECLPNGWVRRGCILSRTGGAWQAFCLFAGVWGVKVYRCDMPVFDKKMTHLRYRARARGFGGAFLLVLMRNLGILFKKSLISPRHAVKNISEVVMTCWLARKIYLDFPEFLGLHT
ncbi:MAG: hypothetical protein IKW48_06860 [Akkermansia sp.]|nr:hypothetical protein [Akkermansia sp.]